MRGAMVASIWVWLTPVFILGGMLLLLGSFAVLARVRGGRYVRPIMQGLARLPLVGKGIRRASQAALEQQNPDLASAIRKLERMGAGRDPQRAQKALSSLTAAERRAYLAAVDQQGTMPSPLNRQQRRQSSRVRKNP
jgi:hypothetical protein